MWAKGKLDQICIVEKLLWLQEENRLKMTGLRNYKENGILTISLVFSLSMKISSEKKKKKTGKRKLKSKIDDKIVRLQVAALSNFKISGTDKLNSHICTSFPEFLHPLLPLSPSCWAWCLKALPLVQYLGCLFFILTKLATRTDLFFRFWLGNYVLSLLCH